MGTQLVSYFNMGARLVSYFMGISLVSYVLPYRNSFILQHRSQTCFILQDWDPDLFHTSLWEPGQLHTSFREPSWFPASSWEHASFKISHGNKLSMLPHATNVGYNAWSMVMGTKICHMNLITRLR